MYLGTVDHIWNSNYLGGRGRILDWGLRSVQGKVIKTLSGNKAGVGTMAQTYKQFFGDSMRGPQSKASLGKAQDPSWKNKLKKK
jgi:hypothetical protein